MERMPPPSKNPFLVVRMRMLDGEGNFISEPVEIAIDASGHADISKLPEPTRKTLESYGVKDEIGNGRVFPNEGERFVRLLMKWSGRQWYCATTPEPEDV